MSRWSTDTIHPSKFSTTEAYDEALAADLPDDVRANLIQRRDQLAREEAERAAIAALPVDELIARIRRR